jgi:hypothetical protein
VYLNELKIIPDLAYINIYRIGRSFHSLSLGIGILKQNIHSGLYHGPDSVPLGIVCDGEKSCVMSLLKFLIDKLSELDWKGVKFGLEIVTL